MTWENQLKKNICGIEQLKKYIKLTPKEEKQLRKAAEIHPMSISRHYLSLINKKDKNDPIRRMAVPSEEELNLLGSYDTSGEAENTKMPGLQHKYKQTALILATNRCATYCRFCFRKRLVGLPNKEVLRRFDDAVRYIKKHKEINNVLISGGDPFMLPTRLIEKFLEKLSPISHLDFIRFGTRTLVTFPDRILKDKTLLNVLKKYSRKNKRIYVVTHFNHPNEIAEKSINAVAQLMKHNIIINNQTVLLRGVNDNPRTMAELQNKLVSIGVNPYYVFQCRPVKRVRHHFQVSLFRGYNIIEKAKKKLNGHSKRFKYIMSHKTGKIEIVGIKNNGIYFKYHQAKNSKNIGKFFKRKLNKTGGWLDDFQ